MVYPTISKAQMLNGNLNQNGAQNQRRYSFGVSTTFASNFYSLSDEVNNSLTNITAVNASYLFAQDIRLIGSLSLAKDLRGDREQDFNDGALTAMKNVYQFNKHLSLNAAASLFVPISETSRISQSLDYAVQFAPSLFYNAGHLVKGLSLIYQPAIRFNFHEFTTQTDGTSNSKYRLRNRLLVNYSLTDTLFLSLDNSYSRFWRYSGQTTDIFSFDQSITYLFTQNLMFSIGHSIGGSALALNGRDSNVRFFDTDESTYYLSLSYQY